MVSIFYLHLIKSNGLFTRKTKDTLEAWQLRQRRSPLEPRLCANEMWHGTQWIVHNIMIKLSQIFIANKIHIDTRAIFIRWFRGLGRVCPSSKCHWIFTAENSDITLPMFALLGSAAWNDTVDDTVWCSVSAWCAYLWVPIWKQWFVGASARALALRSCRARRCCSD